MVIVPRVSVTVCALCYWPREAQGRGLAHLFLPLDILQPHWVTLSLLTFSPISGTALLPGVLLDGQTLMEIPRRPFTADLISMWSSDRRAGSKSP